MEQFFAKNRAIVLAVLFCLSLFTTTYAGERLQENEVYIKSKTPIFAKEKVSTLKKNSGKMLVGNIYFEQAKLAQSSSTAERIVELIEESETPLSPVPTIKNWALVNLVVTLSNVLIGAFVLLQRVLLKQEKTHKNKYKLGFGWEIATFFMGLISIISFLLVSDIQTVMTIVNRWTVLFVAILGMQGMFIVLPRFVTEEYIQYTVDDD